jgi:hypothetical protein
MKVKQLKVNPENPQKFDDLDKLQASIRDFPKMMTLRPMIYDPETMYVLGGNKRLICIQNLGMDEIPDTWVKSAVDLTEDEKKRFIIQDNLQVGTWDWDMLQDWDSEELEEWGLDLPEDIDIDKMEFSDTGKNDSLDLVECPKCGFKWEKR